VRARRRLVALVMALAAVTGAVLLRRRVAERVPRGELNGAGELHGSLDTWPVVARAPSGN
jgi:hypothetical protein